MTDVIETAEATWQCAEAFETIVLDVVEGRLPLQEFAKHLQDTGASPVEGEDYLQQLTQQLEQQRKGKGKERQLNAQPGEPGI